ncbi:putative DNA endonuclease SmrA [Roseisalinus antarcticus]|uniref:Putative DNA endonuclease SmrA n=2 Tax=Roseisalinus antarcticus TaxID=254357 RepID=A0A1Y5S2P3_9RHOB|nr:putative DNA endonuclease SmrA [Roseisalinus antarcticus]
MHRRRPDPAPSSPTPRTPQRTLTRPEDPPAPRRIEKFEVGARVDHSRDHDLMAGLSEQMAKAAVRMDRKTHTRLKRGKLRPEARIDLHGMTLDAAHPALMNFILSAHADGKRLVLVITGKGKHRDEPGPIPQRLGVLRHQVPQWLRMAPLVGAVLDVTPAHASHGGQGAYYVYLRRRR